MKKQIYEFPMNRMTYGQVVSTNVGGSIISEYSGCLVDHSKYAKQISKPAPLIGPGKCVDC